MNRRVFAAATLLLTLFSSTPGTGLASARAQALSPDGVWEWVDESALPLARGADPLTRASAYQVFALDQTALFSALDDAPLEVPMLRAAGTIFSLPMPDGRFARFRVQETDMLGPDVLEITPQAQTWIGQGIDDPTAVAHIDWTDFGLRAQISGAGGMVIVDPYHKGDTNYVTSAWKRDYERGTLECGTRVDEAIRRQIEREELDGLDRSIPPSGNNRYSYTCILTAPGEFTSWAGGTSAANSALITIINRVSQIYERDFSIRLVFFTSNIYSNASTDPFTNGSLINDTTLDENQADVVANYFEDQYDFGHVITRRSGGYGGIGDIGGVCDATRMFRGGSAGPDPLNDAFIVDYVAHEIGHQFGGLHTFDDCDGSTQRTSISAVEPGSGGTIMGYAGICDADDVQANSFDHFHADSLDRIINARNGGCGSVTFTGNDPPVAQVPADFQIPRDTPFVLFGKGTDSDDDALTYSWEQFDQSSTANNITFGPLFRAERPKTVNYREFPPRTWVRDGTTSPWLKLPTVNRNMTFRFVVRDNVAGSGGVDDAEFDITVSGAPFRLTSPNGGESYKAGQGVTVTWDKGGSVQPNVDILIYVGGTSPILLANDTPNDGSHTVRMPCGVTNSNNYLEINTATGAIPGGYIYDWSDGGFALTDGTPDFRPYTPPGWADDLIVTSNTQPSDGVQVDNLLTGDQNNHIHMGAVNGGSATGCGEWSWRIVIDGATSLDLGGSPMNAGFFRSRFNVPRTISGGRHTIWQHADALGAIPEMDETNNIRAKQYVFTPTGIDPDAVIARAVGPDRLAGSGLLDAGTSFFANTDALRIRPRSSAWRVVATSPDNGSSDYDIRLFSISTDAFTGFETALTSSTAGGGSTDGIVVNNANANGSYDVGILRYSGSSGVNVDYHETPATPLTNGGATQTVAFVADQMVDIRELQIGGSDLNEPMLLQVDGTTANQNFVVYEFSPSATRQSISSGSFVGTVSAGEIARFERTYTTSGSYAFVFRRQVVDGAAPVDLDVQFRRYPADLAAVTLPGSYAPLIPTFQSTVPVGQPVPAPTFLEGNTFSTVMAYHFANVGIGTTVPYLTAFDFDGVEATERDVPFPDEAAGDPTQIYSQGLGPFLVRGGRHTVGIRWDSSNTNEEIDESNNDYAEQFVWSPLEVTSGPSVNRGTPPDPSGGFALIAPGVPTWPNVDGLRASFGPSGGDGYFGAFAMMPPAGADYDLEVHPASQGAQDGFGPDRGDGSYFGGSTVDFVVLDFDGALSSGDYDAGVYTYSGSGNYRLQAVNSVEIGTVGPGFVAGPFELEGEDLLFLSEFLTPLGASFAGSIELEILGGDANVGLAVYERNDATGYYNPADAVARVDVAGPGASETVSVALPADGFYGLAVHKIGADDLGRTLQFQLRFRLDAATDAPAQLAVRRTAIESIHPNPFNPQTNIQLALREEGRAEVTVFAVDGSRVRTLVDGTLPAGRHDVVWDGRDDRGRSVSSGVYFLRLTHPDGQDLKKAVLVK